MIRQCGATVVMFVSLIIRLFSLFFQPEECFLSQQISRNSVSACFFSEANSQMLQLQNILEGVSLNESTDIWLYIWNTGQFSVKRAYNHLSGHLALEKLLPQ